MNKTYGYIKWNNNPGASSLEGWWTDGGQGLANDYMAEKSHRSRNGWAVWKIGKGHRHDDELVDCCGTLEEAALAVQDIDEANREQS